LLAGCSGGGLPDAPSEDAGADVPDDAPLPLRADAGPNLEAYVDEDVVLDGSRSTGALTFAWAAGDGQRVAASVEPRATVRYAAPGRYSAVLTIEDAEGTRRTDVAVVSVTRRPVFAPRASGSIAIVETPRPTLAVAVADADALATFALDGDGVPGSLVSVPVCEGPRQVAAVGARFVVSCWEGDALAVIEGGRVTTLPMPRGSGPFGVLALDDDTVLVALQFTGEVAVVELAPLAVVRRLPALPDPRALALLPDGRVLVARWRSPDTGGELVALDVATGDRAPIGLAVDPQIASDTEIGGVPSYLSSIAVSPDGALVAIASLQAAIGEGSFRAGRPLRFETTVRAAISFLDVAADGRIVEDTGRRRQLDNRGFANAVVFSERGDFAYVATRGNRTVERYDALADNASGSLQDLGFAIEGLARRGARLYVDVSLSRTLRTLALDGTEALEPFAEAATVEAEPLSPEVLLGARLFDDSADPRLSRDGYIACAHCHLDGLDDHRTWDFTDRGEGLRNTIDLSGRRGEGHGPIHWSGNFDELEDFENDLRHAFRGTGLMSDADFAVHEDTLGAPKRGLSDELDALAAYVRTLPMRRSPHRREDGSLEASAERGRTLFLDPARRCTTCHAGEELTDSAFVSPGVPRLHDVGTLGPGSGMRLGGALTGLDTPTLRGLFLDPPYLHDGSAPTLRAVLRERNVEDRHGVTRDLSDAQLDDLVAYLLSLE
jgi:mono/diheme cytochrome c family protein